MAFSFIVAGGPWEPRSDTFPISRVLESTERSLLQQFQPNGQLDFASVMQLPTLFLHEEAPFGRVGRIVDLRVQGSNYHIDYQFDDAVPAVPSSRLEKMADRLHINQFEFTRTHWAVKAADLFYVLHSDSAVTLPRPTLFRLKDLDIQSDLVSVMMPFDAKLDPVFSTIREVTAEMGLTLERVDQVWDNDHVYQDIVDLITKSRVVIFDLSFGNTNVFYEAGIAHTIGRDCIFITQTSSSVPFDVRHVRYLEYLQNQEGLQDLKRGLRGRITTLLDRR